MAHYGFDPPTHTLLSHIHNFILTIGLHSYEPYFDLTMQHYQSDRFQAGIAHTILYVACESHQNKINYLCNSKKKIDEMKRGDKKAFMRELTRNHDKQVFVKFKPLTNELTQS